MTRIDFRNVTRHAEQCRARLNNLKSPKFNRSDIETLLDEIETLKSLLQSLDGKNILTSIGTLLVEPDDVPVLATDMHLTASQVQELRAAWTARSDREGASGMTQRVLTKCPYCGKYNPLHEAIREKAESREPGLEPGAVSFCVGCGQFALFDDNLTLRKPEKDELADILRDDKAKVLVDVWKSRRRTA